MSKFDVKSRYFNLRFYIKLYRAERVRIDQVQVCYQNKSETEKERETEKEKERERERERERKRDRETERQRDREIHSKT
jgi:hypothetical protein